MDTVKIILLVCVAVLLIVSALVAEWQLFISNVSQRELMRRANAGSKSAKATLRRDGQVPRLKIVRLVLIAISFGLATVLMVELIGPIWSVVGLIVAMVVFLWLRQLKLIKKITRLSSKRVEKVLIRRVERWNWLSRLERPESATGLSISSIDELQTLVAESSDAIGGATAHQVLARMGFDSQTVSDHMTPLAEIDSIAEDEVLGPLVLDDLHKTGHSHFPVISKDIHHVVGVLDLPKSAQLTKQSSTAKATMDDMPMYIRDDGSLTHALHGFLHSHRQLFIVVNEQRETVGVLSLSDVIETLLSHKIDDRFDQFDDLKAVAAQQHNNAAKGKMK